MARVCRFYYLKDCGKLFALLLENSRSAISPIGRILSSFECMHHLEISNQYYFQSYIRGKADIILHERERDRTNTDATIRLPHLRQLTIRNPRGTALSATVSGAYSLQTINLSAIYKGMRLSPLRLVSVVSDTLAQSQSSLKLFHLEGAFPSSEMSSWGKSTFFEGLQSLLGSLTFSPRSDRSV